MTSNYQDPPDYSNYEDDDVEYQFLVDDEDDDWRECPACEGLGTDNWDDDELCDRCGGQGEIPVVG